MGWFRWQGLEDYSKELKEQERYDQAFKLQEEASEFKQKTYDLQLKTLEQTKEYQTNKIVVDTLQELRKAGLGFGGGSSTTSSNFGGSGSSKSLTDPNNNKHWLGKVTSKYPEFTPKATELLEKTNLQKNAGFILNTFIEELEKTNFQNTGIGFLSEDQITKTLNRIVESEVELDISGMQGFIDSLVGDAGDKVKKQLEESNLFSKINTMISVGNVDPKKKSPTAEVYNQIKTNVFNQIESRIDYEKDRISNTLASFERKRREGKPFSDKENELEAWMRKRNLQIKDIGTIQKGNNNVYKFYGTNSFVEQQVGAYTLFEFPKNKDESYNTPDPQLKIKDTVLFVPSLSFLEYLYKIGMVREGQPVRVPESQADSDGNTVFKTPAFNR